MKVDLTAPETAIDDAPSDPSSDASPSFEFSSDKSPARPSSAASTAAPGAHARRRRDCRALPTAATRSMCARPTPRAMSIRRRLRTRGRSTQPPRTPRLTTSLPTRRTTRHRPSSSRRTSLARPSSAASTAASGRMLEPRDGRGPLDGSHTFEVRATDAASNVDPTPASHTWTVDTVAPDSSFSDVPADPSNDTTPAFEFSANEAGSTFSAASTVGPGPPARAPQRSDRWPTAPTRSTFVRRMPPGIRRPHRPRTAGWSTSGRRA